MIKQERFEHRANTQIITLREVAQEFAEPERLRLQLSAKVMKKPLDIGSWAYCIRGKNESASDDRGTPVVLDSFVESRRELIVKVLESLVGLRDESVLGRFKCLEQFIDWLDRKDYKEIFASEVAAQRAYRAYTAHLNERIAQKKLKPISSNMLQGEVATLIALLYPENGHHILAGALRIRGERESAAVSEAHVELYRDLCLAIAQQLSDLILNNKTYPWVVTIRDYEVVVFPSTWGAVGPFKESPLSYNAAERRIATLEEYWSACDRRGRKKYCKSKTNRTLNDSQDRLQAANGDARHWHRLNMASLAAKAYACLFLMITGATPTEFAQFSYADALEVEKSPIKKELSAVKFRAGGRLNGYNIGRGNGLDLLKEYLKLREWILNGVTHERLFFSMPEAKSKNVGNPFGELDVSGMFNNFQRSISGTFLDPKVPRLPPRLMRRFKSAGLHTAGQSPSAVAASLGHTEAVNQQSYAQASSEQMESEFGQFWQAVRHAAQVVRERSEKAVGGEIATPAGHCDGFNQPIPVRDLGAVAIEPNCRTQYGCLYCEHYICHSDEQDLHKLLSLQYVINAVRKVTPDAAHAEALYKELSIRIEFILDALAERSDAVKQLVETVRAKVFEYGELTAFWEARLNRYEQMGVVF
ncbi:hypothetical protein SAMN05216576_1153 [Ectopseudomonas chengduensis]|uniref:Uncharacterized protein n=2 Tax=Ectopseudomonas chengduensis TaxID=489632 RepID=A0A1G6U4V8_9GAMM|nr:hypothetical protein [Pseudomonas chengduensis]MBP3063066.1 hypothetical protein [Pseudomonas chengduensis]NNB76740.1 hypothetical protein [Pseudomonas chengduensis]SDD36254.1 hypothetical protein SAMN05216576_1153 [Pseudomonas chengduensis]